jgi:CRP/FNR family cyclic AMP-dependent transcriptional regulator
MDTQRRILIAHPNEDEQRALMEKIGACIAGADYSFAKDGTEAMFKLTNAPHHLAFLATDLPKRSAIQITESVIKDRKFDELAVVLLSPIPDNEHFVDEVLIGRVQFLQDIDNSLFFEKTLARAFNYHAQGDKSEFHLRFLASGDLLMLEGEKADNVYLVRKGRLRAKREVNGSEKILGFVEVGEFVGEMAYINHEPRSADVLAETACELIEIPVESLDHVLFQKPAWTKALMRTLSRRLKTANLRNGNI